jgi:outer membrane immunogenic protein
MKNSNLIVSAAVALGAIHSIGAASAADMAVGAQPVVTHVNWTGCYVGLNGGALWARKNWTVSNTGAPITSQEVDGALAGGQVGCNYQVPWDPMVFGIQGDYDWSSASGRTNDQIFAGTDGTRIKSLGSVTGRVGYAWDQFLGYVKGGVAWEKDNYDTTFIATGVVFSTASSIRDGWTLGVGGEYAFTKNLTGFVEYDYYDLGTRRTAFTVVTNGTQQFANIREQKSALKGGLNWKFDWFQPFVGTRVY